MVLLELCNSSACWQRWEQGSLEFTFGTLIVRKVTQGARQQRPNLAKPEGIPFFLHRINVHVKEPGGEMLLARKVYRDRCLEMVALKCVLLNKLTKEKGCEK